jgi:integrase
MRGGIQKKGNAYYAVIYDGVDPGTGGKRRRWVPAGTRRSDAERLLADLIRRKYDGEHIPTEKLTLGEYLTERWLPVQQSRLRARRPSRPPGRRPRSQSRKAQPTE